MTDAAKSLEQVVGLNMRLTREQLGLSQDEVAAKVRAIGLPWSRSSVTAVEAGAKTLDLGEVVLAAVALAVPVRDLLAGNGNVRIAQTTLALSHLRKILGDGLLPDDLRLRVNRPATSKADAGAAGEADQKAARRLRVDVSQLSAAANRLWGCSLTAERNRRLGNVQGKPARSIQALRGRITRTLLEELEPVIEPKGRN
jgi:transcriptional regulator with XRE-family HTH domain